MFKFGIAERDITPKPRMIIPGYFEARFVTGALDNLYTKVMVFEGDEGAFVMAEIDCINLERDDILRMRLGIMEACGIPEENIHISATHTHTGGPMFDWYSAGARNPIYLTMLIDATVEAAKAAFDARVPAKIGFTKTELEGYSWIRRYRMKDGSMETNPGRPHDVLEPIGTPDNSVIVGKVTDESGKLLAFISNYGVHLDMVSGTKVSADYPGEISRCVKEKFGEDVISFFFTGPCGNTNHFNGSAEKTPGMYDNIHIKTGKALFDKICEVEGNIELSSDVKVKGGRDFFTAKRRTPTEENLKSANDYVRGITDDFIGIPRYMNLPDSAKNVVAKATIDAYYYPTSTIDTEVAAVTIGDAIFAFWPAEVFVEFGKELRAEFADKNVFIAELSNGSIGCYVTTEAAVAEGGYEPSITGVDMVEPKTGTLFVEKTSKIVKSL